MVQLIIKNGRVVTPGGVLEADVVVDRGKIMAIIHNSYITAAETEIDAEGRFVIPGAIDSHCHMGQTDKRLTHIPEHTLGGNFSSESRAAVTGGTTTAFNYVRFSQDSLLNVLLEELEAVKQKSSIDVAFHGYIMNELHLEEYDRYVSELGLKTFKIFMPYRGQEALDLGGLSSLTGAQMYRAFEKIARTPGGMAMIHAEDGDIVEACTEMLKKTGRQDLAAWSEARPDYSEGDAVARAVYLARKTNCRLCIVHISSGEGTDTVETFGYQKAVVETCPQYLSLHTDLPLGPLGKTCPPLRGPRDVDALWTAIERGTIQMIGTDHNSWMKQYKQELWSALGGLPAINMTIPVMFTEGYDKRGLSVERIVELVSTNSAKILGLWPRKGVIQVGADADLVIVDTGIRKTITNAMLNSCVDYTPFEGYTVTAWPYATVVRGQVGYLSGELRSVHPGSCLNVPSK